MNFADSNQLLLLEVLEDDEMSGFLNVIEPLISQGCDRVHEEIQTLESMYPDLPYDSSTIEEVLFENLPGSLLSMLERTMVL